MPSHLNLVSSPNEWLDEKGKEKEEEEEEEEYKYSIVTTKMAALLLLLPDDWSRNTNEPKPVNIYINLLRTRLQSIDPLHSLSLSLSSVLLFTLEKSLMML